MRQLLPCLAFFALLVSGNPASAGETLLRLNAGGGAYDVGSFARFMEAYPQMTGADALANADFDGDGKTNLLEHFLGTSPVIPDAGAVELLRIPGAGFRFGVTPDPAASDVSGEVWFSTDLAQWSRIGLQEGAGGLWYAMAPPDADDGFFKLAITQLPEWIADTGFAGGSVTSFGSPVAGTAHDPIYQTERIGNFSYAFALENGIYHIVLHVAENYWTQAGMRLFDVTAQGLPALAAFDIWAQAGHGHAHRVTFPVRVVDGQLQIGFNSVVDNAKLSALEILLPDLGIHPWDLKLPTALVGGEATGSVVYLANQSGAVITIERLALEGDDTLDFAFSPNAPIQLVPGAETQVAVTFAPGAPGDRSASVVVGSPQLAADRVIALSGRGVTSLKAISIDPPAVNFGNANLASTAARQVVFTNEGAADVSLTALEVEGAAAGDFGVTTELPIIIPVDGFVTVGLEFAPSAGGLRSATMSVEGDAESGPAETALSGIGIVESEDTLINVGGGQVVDSLGQIWLADTHFTGGNGFEVAGTVAGTGSPEVFRTERIGDFTYSIPVANGTYELTFYFAEQHWSLAGRRVFNVTVEGQPWQQFLDLFSLAGKDNAIELKYEIGVSDGVLDIGFESLNDFAKLNALRVHAHSGGAGHPYLHVVIRQPGRVIDFDGDGSEVVRLDGRDSHTHELGRTLTDFTWTGHGGSVLGTGQQLEIPFPTGSTHVTLTIGDDNVPQETLAKTTQVIVQDATAVAGFVAEYYPAGAASLGSFIDNLPAAYSFIEFVETPRLTKNGAGGIGGSPFFENLVVVFRGSIDCPADGLYAFDAPGAAAQRLFLGGAEVAGPVPLVAGSHVIEWRIAIADAGDLPIDLLWSIDGGTPGPIPETAMQHDESGQLPFINSMPATGFRSGGSILTIRGTGFFPAGAVTVNWGGQVLTGQDFISYDDRNITLSTPAGEGSIDVSVTTPNGTTANRVFTYVDDGPAPVLFETTAIASSFGPTRLAWGPDHRLYVATLNGLIQIFTFDDDYAVTDVETITTLSTSDNPHILGIAFHPAEANGPARIYIAHSQLYANGGTAFVGPSPYTGQMSVLEGPDFDAVQPLITQLPTSNHDHGVNGLVFDDCGDLYIAVGGNTNAGIKDPTIGDLPESPFSAAVVKAWISRDGFNGAIEYVERDTGLSNNDQVFGEDVVPVDGLDVEVFTAGFRNPFDVTWTTQGRIYGTDNGPNSGFGPASTGPDTSGTAPEEEDELMHHIAGAYYGHPNRQRARECACDTGCPNPPGGRTSVLHLTRRLAAS